MQYTLTKYLTADYLRENDFLKAYLELVDEIIFCCSMESLDVLSNMSFESMDDNYFLAYQNFFLNGLSTYDINKLDKLVLSEWFSLLHVRGELSDIDKLLKFGGSLKNKEKNVFEIYHNADVPNQAIDTTKDGLIYLITENNIDLDQDYLISQQVPAGYRIGLMRTPPPALVTGGDAIYLGEKNVDATIHVKAGDVVDLHKGFEGDITFYRRRQFDQYYTFGQVYRSQYTINQLSQYHQKGYYFFGFEIEHTLPLPVSYDVDETAYGCITSTYGEFFISDGQIVNTQSFIYSGSFEYPNSFVTLADLNFEDGRINRDDTIRNNYSLIDNFDFGYGDVIDFNINLRNNYDFINSTTEFPGGKFVSKDDISFDGMFEHPVFISTEVLEVLINEPQEEEQNDTSKSYIVINNGVVTQSIDVEDIFIHQIEQKVEIVNFYFTPRGSNETKDSLLESRATIPLYNADGTLANEAQYDGVGTVTFTQSNGNMFETPLYSNLVSLSNGNLVLRTNTSYKANSVQVEHKEGISLCGVLTSNSDVALNVNELPCGVLYNYIEIDVGMRWYNNQWNNVTLDDWWYAGLLNQDDVDTITEFGLSSKTNDRVLSFGNLEFNPNYQYTILCIYDKVIDGHGADVLSYDLDNFYIENSNKYPSYNFNNQVLFEYITALSSQARAYRLRIKKYSPSLERHIAYTSTDKTPTSITNGSHCTLYDENGNTISVGNSMRYDMLVYYASASDTAHSYAEAGFVCVDFWSYSNLVLNNGNSSGITIQRIEYTVCKKNDAPPVTEKEAYFTSQGASSTTDFGLGANGYYLLYDSAGNRIDYDSLKTYTILSAQRLEQGYEEWTQSEIARFLTISNESTLLVLRTGSLSDRPYHNGIHKLVYKES